MRQIPKRTLVTVQVPKKWWCKFRKEERSTRDWLAKRVTTLLQDSNTYRADAHLSDRYQPYFYKALLREFGWKKWNHFLWPECSFGRWNPMKDWTTVQIETDPETKKQASLQLLNMGITWKEFILCKLEDYLLSQKQYAEKGHRWFLLWRNYRYHLTSGGSSLVSSRSGEK